MLSLLLTALLCSLAGVWCEDSQVDIDLQLGVVTGYSDRVQFLTTPTAAHNGQCSRQAVIQVDLSGSIRMAQVSLHFRAPRLWTFHLSDSNEAEGYGSIFNVSSAAGEIHVVNQQLRVYSKWPAPNSVEGIEIPSNGGSPVQWMYLQVVDDTILKQSQIELTLPLRENVLRWQDERLAHDFSAPPGLLQQQNSDNSTILYIGMNRVIKSDWRYGSGLCKISLRLMEVEEQCNATEMGCDPNAICKPTRKGYRCSCKGGWEGNGQKCKDIDECRLRNGGCVHDCINTPGSYQCKCHTGFVTDPQEKHNCLDINECAFNNGGCQISCTNTIGSFECSCGNTNLVLSPDRKKCIYGNPVCRKNDCQQSCTTNQQNQFLTCSCWPNYQLNQTDYKSCFRTCSHSNGGCHHHCLDTNTGPVCTCQYQYLLGFDGITCNASCSINNGGCHKRCTNTDIGVECSCPPGYTLDSDRKTCIDINECGIDNGGCSHQCVNIIGGYECVCPDGYKIDPIDEKTCLDVDECSLNETCDHTCINLPGIYRCECDVGFQLFGVSHCGDINECSINNGQCKYGCLNTIGSFQCSSVLPDPMQSVPIDCKDHHTTGWNILLTSSNVDKNITKCGDELLKALKLLPGFDCYIQLSKVQLIENKRLLKKYDKVSGQLIQVSVEMDCGKPHNVSCDKCGVKKLQFNLCQMIQKIKDSISQTLAVIRTDSHNWSVVQKSFSVQRKYTDYCKDLKKTDYDQCNNKHGSNSSHKYPSEITKKKDDPDYCLQGSMWNKATKLCELCPEGTYQDKPRQSFCITCPGNSTTDDVGAISVNECKRMNCGSFINELTGYIESPNYPGNYPNNADCSWTVKAPRGRRLLIIVPQIKLAGEMCDDFLVMRKSKSPYSPVTYEACKSSDQPVALIAQSKRLWMQFKSNGQGTAQGFHIPFVNYNEEYQPLIEDIVQDSRLYASENHLKILKDKKLLNALMEVIAQPANYYKYANEQRKMFPSSFIKLMTPKVKKFFSYRRR